MQKSSEPIYIITRPRHLAEDLASQLHQWKIKNTILPFIDLIPDIPNLNLISQILPQYPQVLFSSPSSIYFMSQYFANLKSSGFSFRNTIQFIVVGQASKDALIKAEAHTMTQTSILAPHHGSGINAIINEGLIKLESPLLIIGGDKINSKLAVYLETHADMHPGTNYQFISLYRTYSSIESNLALLEKILLNNSRTGIIITSSQIAQILINLVKKSVFLRNGLHSSQLISIHPQITEALKCLGAKNLNPQRVAFQEYGFQNLYQTLDATNLAIINLIRKLQYG